MGHPGETDSTSGINNLVPPVGKFEKFLFTNITTNFMMFVFFVCYHRTNKLLVLGPKEVNWTNFDVCQ